MYTVKVFATLTGVTERTLHYYDRQGVLSPTSYTENGHRLYSNDDIFRMQKILTLKYLGFTLKDITHYLSEHSTTSLHETLMKQKQLLAQKRDEIDHIIGTMTRVEQLMKTEQVDSDLLLTIIHSIQHEKKLLHQLPKHVAEQVLMHHVTAEEKLQIERDLLKIVHTLQRHFNQGIRPDSSQVQCVIEQLHITLAKVVDVQSQQELQALATKEQPLHHVSQLSEAFQQYVERASQYYHDNEGNR